MTAHGFGGGRLVSTLYGMENIEVFVDRRVVNPAQCLLSDDFTHQLHQFPIAGDFRREPPVPGGLGDGGVEFAIAFPIGIHSSLVPNLFKGSDHGLDPILLQARRCQSGRLDFEQ